MDSFYHEVLRELLDKKTLTPQSRLLVLCGGSADRVTLLECGFQNVVISNLDTRMEPEEFAPYEWCHQDAENVTFADGSFDFVLAHLGLHHCYSPHRALLEMYRVARDGILLFEPYDNFMTRLGVRFGVGQEYEYAAVYYNDCNFGGVCNSPIPNFVYRWTERDIIQTIQSFNVLGKNNFRFIYRLRVPWVQLRGRKNKIFYYSARLVMPLLKLFFRIFPKQSNNFAAVVLKPRMPEDLHPWLQWENGAAALNKNWLNRKYNPITPDNESATPSR